MAPYALDGSYRPSRPSDCYCSVCRRVFAADAVPTPYADGRRICRDCRWQAVENTPATG